MFSILQIGSILLFPFYWTGAHSHGQGEQRLAYDIHQFCKGDQFPGIYSRDLLQLRCCKQRSLQEPIDLQLFSRDKWDCDDNVIRDNPDDNVATTMWKIKTCRLQNLMGVPENEINFKSVVDVLTQNYTTENDVKTLIQNANLECSDGDKQTETYAKLQTYLNCFYENEQKICEEKWDNSTIYKENFLKRNNISNTVKQVATGCISAPGVWKQKSFCCDGFSTPESWETYVYTKYYGNSTSHSFCLTAIYKFRSANNAGFKYLPPSPSREDFKKQTDYEYPFECNDACTLNPVIFSNGTNPSMNWELDSVLDKAFAAFSLKVKKELKAYVLKQKPAALVAITQAESVNKTGLSYESIEKQYEATDDNIEKLKYYCSYYKGLKDLVTDAVTNHCSSNKGSEKNTSWVMDR